MTITQLNPVRVTEIFLDCMSREDDTGERTTAENTQQEQISFDTERLRTHEGEITEFLSELPDEFKQSVGRGASILGAHMNRHGVPWTDHQSEAVEQLFLLGVALGKAWYLLPRELWQPHSHGPGLPEGQPIIVVETRQL